MTVSLIIWSLFKHSEIIIYLFEKQRNQKGKTHTQRNGSRLKSQPTPPFCRYLGSKTSVTHSQSLSLCVSLCMCVSYSPKQSFRRNSFCNTRPNLVLKYHLSECSIVGKVPLGSWHLRVCWFLSSLLRFWSIVLLMAWENSRRWLPCLCPPTHMGEPEALCC